MAEDFMNDNTKKQQIDKIFQVIDKNKDNKEICKIAFDTLNSKCLENPSIIFPIMTNFLSLISKGNLKLIEDGNQVLISFFEDFSNKELTKILLDNDIKKGLLSQLKDGKLEYPFYIEPYNNSFSQLNSISYITMDLFKEDFNVNKYAPLYKEDSKMINKNNLVSNKSEEIFSKGDINILFQNDQTLKNKLLESFNKKGKEKDVEEEEDEEMNEDNNKDKISVEELYSKYSKIFDMKLNNKDDKNDNIDILNESRKKIRKLNDNSKEISLNITFYPFFGFIMEILKYNHMPYHTQRTCSITLLQLLEKQFDKLLYYPYEIKVNLLSDYTDIINITIKEKIKIKKYEKIKEILQINMMIQFLYNSIIDKVFDSSNPEYICLLKDMNLKTLSLIINNISNDKIKKDFYQKTIMLLNIFFKDKDDWHPLFAILTLYKYISFNSDGIIFVKFGLFNILNNIIDTDKEEIRDLIIKILDKSLSEEMIDKIEVEVIMGIFNKFVGLIQNYDDIDIGVKDYFSCLYNFTKYFSKRPQIKEICFNKFHVIFKNDAFILHSLNKMKDVRIKFYEVVNHLIIDGFYFDKDILEKLILMSFQGLCLEENKKLLKTQKEFLENILYSNNPDMLSNAYNTFEKNLNIIFYLFLTPNINKVENLYYPMNDDSSKSLVRDLYKSFFLNDVQINDVKIKYEQKITNIIPLIASLIRIQIGFIENVYSNLNINPMSLTTDLENIPLRPEFLLFLRIVLYYLLIIEPEQNKVLLISDETLTFFSEQSNLKEMTIEINDNNRNNTLLNCVNAFKKFSLDHIKKELPELEDVIKNLKSKKLCLIRALNQSMKEIYVKIQEKNNEQLKKICCEHIQKIKDIIMNIEKIQNTHELRLKVRGYACACYFMHTRFKGQKTPKISSITNSFLNCLKINNKESKMFVHYLVSFLSTIENKETFNKIIFTFFENNIKMCQDLLNITDSKISTKKSVDNDNDYIEKLKEFKCYPMKYFFKKYATEHKELLNAQLLIEQYINNLKAQNCETLNEKIIILLFLLPPKGEIKIIKQEQFISILTNIIPNLNKSPEYIFYLTNIIFNAENFFIDYKLKSTLDFLFKQCNHKNTSVFQLINSILDNNKISVVSIDYIFTVLNYINSPNEEIRKISTSIFSKQMKIISILKFSDNYNQITEKNTDAKSLQFISNIFNQNINEMRDLNVKLKIKLRNYQLIGINWLMFLGNYGLGLALCDDMGLGKSIQTLVAVAESTIEYKKKNNKSKPSLIICPNTLIMNWISESKKFFENETLHIENDLEKLHKKKNFNTQVLIYICSYEKARDNFNEIFNNTYFYYLVLDEAHIIKNPKTKMYQAIKKIAAEKRVILTGTPIQNNVMELWALFNFLMPGFLGSENDFEIKYHKKMAQNIKKLNLQEDVQENIFQTSLQEIRKRIKPFILRRLKSEVLKELPEKIISDYNCEMEKSQRELYEKYNVMYNNNKLNTEKSPLSVIDKLRKICDHPYLLDENNKRFKSKEEKEEMIKKSGKLIALEELIISLGFESAMNSKSLINSSSYENKLLIFTQMTKMCTLLEVFFTYKFPGLKILTLTGDIKNKEQRGKIVDTFNNDPSVNVLILTINIGGVGLNLTSANVVIMYDHSWNPSKDMQAIDRAHRLGQKKTVQVFRLITINSIEEQLISLQTFKKYISNNVVDTSKIHEDKVNANSIMQSFEEFSKDKINSMKENIKNKKVSKFEELTNRNEEEEIQEEMEIAYLHKLIES